MALLLFILGDGALSIGSLYLAFVLRFGSMPDTLYPLTVNGAGSLAVFALVVVFTSYFMEFYDREKNEKFLETLVRESVLVCTLFFVFSSLYYMVPEIMFGRGLLALALASFGIFQFLWHLVVRKSLKHPGLASRVLVLGTGPLAQQMGDLITASNRNYILAGYYNCANEAVEVPTRDVVSNGHGLVAAALAEKVHKIVVSLSERRGVFPMKDALRCKFSGIEVDDAPSFYEELTGKLMIESVTPSWFIFSNGFRLTVLLRLGKRIADVVCAALVGILVAPLVPFVVLAIRLDSPGGVLFRQIRVGEQDRLFELYKFRTMRQDAEKLTGAVWAQKNDPRLTRIGGFMRKTRLDELPQLYNVLRGDMSFVGPRPERPEFVSKLEEKIPFYGKRHFVKPGLTGWAQVKYQYGSSVDDAVEKLRYDLYYIKNLSLTLDILIVIETVKVVLLGRGGR